ncbi:MAG TPA: superoxide dismutase [Alphaproteobacteria bacterium]|nr:superoxide dismutase [Alphaproteobacteria bacterium]
MLDTQTRIELPKLPYAENALEPVISARTLSFHYGKHHAGYVANLTKLIEGSAFAGLALEEIVRRAHAEKATPVFNNAAQAWNHTFYWHSMKPQDDAAPKGKLKAALERDFGSVDDFKTQFAKAATAQFGSGWTWLVAEQGKLAIKATANADTPLLGSAKPLLVIDVWEHAYYLDYQNKRPDYVAGWIEKLANWDFAEANLG